MPMRPIRKLSRATANRAAQGAWDIASAPAAIRALEAEVAQRVAAGEPIEAIEADIRRRPGFEAIRLEAAG